MVSSIIEKGKSSHEKDCFWLIRHFGELVFADVLATTQEELGNIGSYVDSVLHPNMTNTANTTGNTYKTHQPLP